MQVDEATIPDPDAVKPPEWDEDAPAQIPDMDATKVCAPYCVPICMVYRVMAGWS
jgi:hypothetical protein